jgi:uncharacterized protein YndB with AHSA1/START domain
MPKITITQSIKAPLKTVYESYLNPVDNLRWNTAGEGWTTSYAKIDARVGGELHFGYQGPTLDLSFDLGGVFKEIVENHKISYLMGDRLVEWFFEQSGSGQTKVSCIFDAEDQNSLAMQEHGWNNILTNFKTFVERKANPNNTSLTKTIVIKSSRAKVWKCLLDDESYRIWTVPFCEGSYYTGEMKYDNKIHFLSPRGDGLVSNVNVCVPEFQISFEHLGYIKDGVEDFDSTEFHGWKGARETYTIYQKEGFVELEIYQELLVSEVEFMTAKWDEALVVLKGICE